MNKQQLLSLIRSGLQERVIKPEDINLILRLYKLSIPDLTNIQNKKGLDFGKIFSLVGGLVVFLGFTLLVGIYWREMSSATRVASTLGVGLFVFSIASYLMISTKQRLTGLALHLISPILISYGLSILVFEVIIGNSASYSLRLISNFLISLLVFGLYLAADYWISSKLFSFVAWIAGTSTYWYFIFFMIDTLQISSVLLYENKIFAVFGLIYCSLIFGILYLSDSNISKKVFNDIVTFGTVSYLLCNVFWFLYDKLVLECLFGLILFLTIYLSVQVNKVAILLAGIVAIVFYISYMSFRYFHNTLGWPISIIIIGLGLIGSGYLFINLKSKIHD